MKKASSFYAESLRLLLCLSFVFVAFGCHPENDKQTKQERTQHTEIVPKDLPETTSVAQNTDTPKENHTAQQPDKQLQEVVVKTSTTPKKDQARRPSATPTKSFADSFTDEEVNAFMLKKKEVQTFNIGMQEVEQQITCKEGTRITIPPLAFVYDDGSPIAEGTPVQLDVREYYTKSDMILCGLATQADGRILESGGMIHVEAAAHGRKVELANNKEITIAMPKQNTKVQSEEGMQTFISNNPSGQSATNWTPLQAQNTPLQVQNMRKASKDHKVRNTVYKQIANEQHQNVLLEESGGDKTYQIAIPVTALRSMRLEPNFESKRITPIVHCYADKKPKHIDKQFIESVPKGKATYSYVYQADGNPDIDSLIKQQTRIDFMNSRLLKADEVYTDTIQLLIEADNYNDFRADAYKNESLSYRSNNQLLNYRMRGDYKSSQSSIYFSKYSSVHCTLYNPAGGYFVMRYNESDLIQNVLPTSFYNHVPSSQLNINHYLFWDKVRQITYPKEKRRKAYRLHKKLRREQRKSDFKYVELDRLHSSPSFILTIVIDVQKQYWETTPKEGVYESSFLLCYDKDAYNQALTQLMTEGKLSDSSLDNATEYVLRSSQFGWINCDRFDKIPMIRKTDMIVKDQTNMRLIFKNINAIMCSSDNSFNKVPKKEEATILAIKKENGKLLVGTEDIRISSVHVPKIKYKTVESFEELENIIANLN